MNNPQAGREEYNDHVRQGSVKFAEQAWSVWFAGPGTIIGGLLAHEVFTKARGCLSRSDGPSFNIGGQTYHSDGICTSPTNLVGLPTLDMGPAGEWLFALPLGAVLYCLAVLAFLLLARLTD